MPVQAGEVPAAIVEQVKHNLRPKRPINYKELSTDVKTKCHSLICKTQAVVTNWYQEPFLPKEDLNQHQPHGQNNKLAFFGIFHPNAVLFSRSG